MAPQARFFCEKKKASRCALKKKKRCLRGGFDQGIRCVLGNIRRFHFAGWDAKYDVDLDVVEEIGDLAPVETISKQPPRRLKDLKSKTFILMKQRKIRIVAVVRKWRALW